MTGLERAIASYYGGIVTAARRPDDGHAVVAARVLAQTHAICAYCQQTIAAGCPLAIQGADSFHPSCARRVDAPAVRRATDRVIGTLTGNAAPMGAMHFVATKRGGLYQTLARGCFDASLATSQPTLQLDHDSRPIPGRLVVSEECGGLRFRFAIFDTLEGAAVRRLAAAQAFTGVSVRFAIHPGAVSYDRNIEIVHTAQLIEISLCRAGRPALSSTYVRLEA